MGEVRLLVDTCTLLWWWSEPNRLSRRCRALLEDPATAVWVSAASAWEIATKHRLGRYPGGGRLLAEWHERSAEDGFTEIPISASHAICSGRLPGEHRDPFDRIIAAQAIVESLAVATPDRALEHLGAERVW